MTDADTAAVVRPGVFGRLEQGWAAFRPNWQAWAALALIAVTMLTPLATDVEGRDPQGALMVGWVGLLGTAALVAASGRGWLATLIAAAGSLAGATVAIALLPEVAGRTAPGYWALVAAAWLLGWLVVARHAEARPAKSWQRVALAIAAPAVFGVWLLLIWEVVVRAFAVPPVILPPPSTIGVRFADALPTLLVDLRQTFFKAVLAGYAIGCLAGFLTALLVDRVPFLKRGLLPIGNLMSALPIVGVAPILVMWFGFDWPSKAAMVVVMVFFPVLVNTLAGLAAAGAIERDLMRTYAASHLQTLVKLRLPAALPFIFNALKISSTLALIGAIVAEFFGSPTAGMGFRISAAVGRLDIALVWSEITVAALAGTAFYGVIALIERATTFWHPSYRG